MLLMGLLTREVVMGGSEVMEAAAEGPSGGERCPEGGEETDELSGLWESETAGRRTAKECFINNRNALQKWLCLPVGGDTVLN